MKEILSITNEKVSDGEEPLSPPTTFAPAEATSIDTTTLSTNIGDLLAAAGVTIQDARNEGTKTLPRLKSIPFLGTSPTALQDLLLNGLRREQIESVFALSDGVQESGVVRAFDSFTVLLENTENGRVQLLYKHSIARVIPSRTPQVLYDQPADKKQHSSRP